jgi:hypothetical protein
VQHGLGGGDGDDQISLGQRRVDTKGDSSDSADVDEILGLRVVDDHPSTETSPELGRHEEADLARRGSPQQSAGDQDRHVRDAEP